MMVQRDVHVVPKPTNLQTAYFDTYDYLKYTGNPPIKTALRLNHLPCRVPVRLTPALRPQSE